LEHFYYFSSNVSMVVTGPLEESTGNNNAKLLGGFSESRGFFFKNTFLRHLQIYSEYWFCTSGDRLSKILV